MLLDVASQVPSAVGAFENLSQYGALGIVAAVMGSLLWVLLKRMLKAEDELKKQVDDLQKQMNSYIVNDQNKLREVIENNSKVMTSLRDIVLELKTIEEHRKP